jgi:hypothetical protein
MARLLSEFYRGDRMSAPTLLLACATLSLTAACTRDDPVSVLEVTTTVTPTLASIAHDTLGVLVTVQVRNPLKRPVRVVTRPGRRLTAGQLSMLGHDAKSSYGLGFSVRATPLDAHSIPGSEMTAGGLPEGKVLRLEAGQALSDTFRLGVRAKKHDQKSDLSAGRFLIRGGWNTIEGPGVEVEVTP